MSNDITTQQQSAIVTMGFGSLQSFEFMQRTAKMFTQSSMVPTAYRAVIQKGYGNNISYEENPSALSNCIIALNMSQRMNADPLMIMQNLHVIEGRPSWSSQYIIASINSCGKFAPLRFHKEAGVEIEATCTTFEWENNKKKAVVTKTRVINAKCIAWTVERGTAIPSFSLEEIKAYGSIYQCCKAHGVPLLESTQVSLEMAVNEGWYGKNGSKWQTMPDLMLQYRSAAFFGRIYAPELLMGLPSADELRDISVLKEQPDGTYAMDGGGIDQSTGEITQPATRTLPDYPDEKFAKQSPKWKAAIDAGEKVSDLLAMLQSKYTLTAEQLAAINALAAPAPAADQAGIEEFVNEMGE